MLHSDKLFVLICAKTIIRRDILWLIDVDVTLAFAVAI